MPTYYHATASENLESIKRQGLLTKFCGEHPLGFDDGTHAHSGVIFIASELEIAKGYALAALSHVESAIVFKIELSEAQVDELLDDEEESELGVRQCPFNIPYSCLSICHSENRKDYPHQWASDNEEEDEEEEDEEEIEAQAEVVQPKKLNYVYYHPTSMRNVASIQERGLLINQRGNNKYGLDTELNYDIAYGKKTKGLKFKKVRTVHLIKDYEIAQWYMDFISSELNTYAVLFKVTLNEDQNELVYPDAEERKGVGYCSVENIPPSCLKLFISNEDTYQLKVPEEADEPAAAAASPQKKRKVSQTAAAASQASQSFFTPKHNKKADAKPQASSQSISVKQSDDKSTLIFKIKRSPI